MQFDNSIAIANPPTMAPADGLAPGALMGALPALAGTSGAVGNALSIVTIRVLVKKGLHGYSKSSNWI
jgi:hypothetical protein